MSRRLAWARLATAALPLTLALAAASPAAAAPPLIADTWVTAVNSTSADLHARIGAEGLPTTYRFEYETEGAYEANLKAGLPPFAGAAWLPVSGKAPSGSGTVPLAVSQHAGSLAAQSAYRYRAVATNSAGTAEGPVRFFATRVPTGGAPPPDDRAFELVSPPDKDGGAIAAPGSLFGGGDFQAAAAGNAFTYSSPNAFADPPGAPPASQYVSRRSASGWSTENVSEPLLSEAYGEDPDGSPYKLFSEDLSRALLEDPRRCEPEAPCPRGYSLRESAGGTLTALPPEAAGMRALAAAPDLASVLFEAEGGGVFEWDGAATLTPAAAPTEPEPVPGIVGVLGYSADRGTVYFQDAAGLKRWRGGTVTTIAAGADAAAPSDWPAATGTARVSADGEHLAFLSAASLGGFDNTDALTGQPDTELYLYGPPPGGGPARLICVSCNPTGERPEGSASIPGAQINGSTRIYKPRVLSVSGNRVFFESSDDLALADTDSRTDVYQWEARGEGDCVLEPGCLGLISRAREHGGLFLDASADGADAYFLTEDSLLGSDPGSIDVYDAREGGGLPEAPPPFDCLGDLCQPLPAAPEDPSPGTLLPHPANPPIRIDREAPRRCAKGKARRKGRCVVRHRHRHKKAGE